MGHWTIRHCLALCIGAIILVATVACGKHHVVSTSQLATPSIQQPAITPQDTGAADEHAWPSDQELIQRYISAKAASLAADAGDKASSFATAPLGVEVKIDSAWIEEIDGKTCITFPYKNPGDYNLDGYITLDDLTILAQHFGQSVAENPFAQAADGNEDGFVNPADITVFSMYRYRYYAGAKVYWSVTEDGEKEVIDAYSIGDVYQDSAGRPLISLRLPADKEYGWYWIEPKFLDEGYGPLCGAFYLQPESGAPNITTITPAKPTARTYELVELQVDYDAAEPCYVSWDFGPNAEVVTPPYYPEKQAAVYFEKAGPQRCTVCVENPLGKDEIVFVTQIYPWDSEPYSISGVHTQGILYSGNTVTFSAVGDCYGAEFYWDLGGAGTPNSSLESSPSILLGAPGRYYASVLAVGERGNVIHHFVIDVGHDDSEMEPNDTPAQADRLPSAGTFEEFSLDAHSGGTDAADWYQIEAPQGRLIKASCDAGNVIRVFDSRLVEIPESVGSVAKMEYLKFVCNKQSSYYLSVTPVDAETSKPYTLTVTSRAWPILDELSDENYRTKPVENLTFPLEDFKGHVFATSSGSDFDFTDTYYFKALAGDHLNLNFDFLQLGEKAASMHIEVNYENPTSGYEYNNDVSGIYEPYNLDINLPYSGTYTLKLWSFLPLGSDIEYIVSGYLSHDEPAISYISPLNVTVGTPTAFYGYAPGAEGWTYKWVFGPDASPQTTTTGIPIVTFNTPGIHSCSLTITNGSYITSSGFTVNVVGWHRQPVSFVAEPKGNVSSLAYDWSGTLNLCTTGGKFYKLEGGQWIQGATFPVDRWIYDGSSVIDGSGNLTVAYSWNRPLTLYRNIAGVWEEEIVDSTGSAGIYNSIALGSQGMLSVTYNKRNLNGLDQIMCARQTASGWELSEISEDDHDVLQSIATDSLGNPWICYHSRKTSGSLLSLAYWDGTQWLDEVVPFSLNNQQMTRSVCLYFDAADNPHIVYETPSPSEIVHVWRDADWHSETVLTANGYEWQSNWSVVKDSLGQPWMLLYSFKSLDVKSCDIGILRQSSGEWIYELVVRNSSSVTLGDLVLDSNDKPHISYTDVDTRTLMHAWRD